MEIINGKKYYTEEEFFDFFYKLKEKAKIDLRKELKELKDLRNEYAEV